MKSPFPYLLAIISALIVFFVQESRISALEEQITETENRTPSSPDEAEREEGALRRISSATPDKSPPETSISRKIDSKPDYSKELMKMFDNEAGQAMMKQGLQMAIPMLFGDFIDSLELSAKEEKHFRDLLVDRMSKQQVLGMKWMQASADEKAELTQQMKETKEQNSAAIDVFLNSDEDSAKFKQYEKELPERQQLGGIRDIFTDAPLSKETEEQLVAAMYDARVNAGEGDGGDDENWRLMSETGSTETMEKRWAIADAKLDENLSNVLSADQREPFRNYWKQARKIQLMQYKMAQQMMGQGSE